MMFFFWSEKTSFLTANVCGRSHKSSYLSCTQVCHDRTGISQSFKIRTGS